MMKMNKNNTLISLVNMVFWLMFLLFSSWLAKISNYVRSICFVFDFWELYLEHFNWKVFFSVYFTLSNDNNHNMRSGFFFAVKEVSLLDQGSQGKQSIFQLKQDISLLSQFYHENIV